jgi:hypothetical protein
VSGSSTLWLSAVTLREHSTAGELTGTMAVGRDGTKTTEPPFFGTPDTGIFSPTFTVSSGPCEVSEGGRCVGRRGGYTANEHCDIVVAEVGGLLGACTVFDVDIYEEEDYLTLPDGSRHYGSDCPFGVALAPGGALSWQSDGNQQGGNGPWPSGAGAYDNGCAAKGTCGLPVTFDTKELGGGWDVCFRPCSVVTGTSDHGLCVIQ